jgi:hypothetical protein
LVDASNLTSWPCLFWPTPPGPQATDRAITRPSVGGVRRTFGPPGPLLVMQCTEVISSSPWNRRTRSPSRWAWTTSRA